MWVYQPTESAEVPLLLSDAPAADAAPTPTVEMQPVQPQTEMPPAARPRKVAPHRHSTADCWLLAAAFLIGAAAAGGLQALCDARQLEVLEYYMDAWRTIFSAVDLRAAAGLFSAEYLTLTALTTALLLFGLSALGPVLIFLLMMLYDLGSGMLFTQLLSAQSGLPVWPLFTGIPAACAAACLCVFGAVALQVSAQIHAYSFWKQGGQAFSGTHALLGQYAITLVLLVPLCGAATGISYLGMQFC